MTDALRTQTPPFIEVKLFGSEPARCVDGRPEPTTTIPQGPQMLGGSIHTMLLKAVHLKARFDKPFVDACLREKKVAGLLPGVHYGAHKDLPHGVCDCGFADKLPIIFETLAQNGKNIKNSVQSVASQCTALATLSASEVSALVADTYSQLVSWAHGGNIAFTQAPLVDECKAQGATLQNLVGDHAERVAYVNTKPNTTLDTRSLNTKGFQAFNLDLWAVLQRGEVLGVPQKFGEVASLMLYIATEMVLVESKGKPALPVVFHL